jgi:hypothetical protein
VGFIEVTDINSFGRDLCDSRTPKTMTPPPLFAIAATSFGKSL